MDYVDYSGYQIGLLHGWSEFDSNHNLLSDMHLPAPVLHLTMCLTLSSFKINLQLYLFTKHITHNI